MLLSIVGGCIQFVYKKDEECYNLLDGEMLRDKV